MTDPDLSQSSSDEPRHVEHPPTVKQMGDPRKQATWTLLPQPPGVCSQCGRDHEPAQPHDLTLAYQYSFYAEHDRWPTWGDALAHCAPEVQAAWKAGLRERGVPEDQLLPSRESDSRS